MKAKVEKIKNHGINCFVNRQLIYNWPEQLFADSGVVSIEHADFEGVERLALVTGCFHFVFVYSQVSLKATVSFYVRRR